MKRIIVLTVMISALGIFCFSKNTRFGINAGGTLAFMKSKYQDRVEIIDGMKAGMNVGVVTEVPIAERICFMPTLNFTQKGGNYRYSYSGYTFEGKRTLNYIELLLNVLYCSPAGDGKFFGGLGPGISIGMSGKYKEEVKFGSQTVEEKGDIKFGNNENDDDYKPIDFGGNIMAGYEFSSSVFFALNYYLGLSSLVHNGNSEHRAKNRYFGIRVGYFLSRLSKK